MADVDERLQSWKNLTEERDEVVFSTLEQLGFQLKKCVKGSHFVYTHPLLKEAYRLFREYFPRDFHPDGTLIVVVHKNHVSRFYLKNILKAVEINREFEELKEKHGGRIER